MEKDAYIFTIFFLLLGPIKLISPFAKATRGNDLSFRRKVAMQAAGIATLIVLLLALLGQNMLTKYEISLDAIRLAGGLVLLISALNSIFPKPQLHEEPPNIKPTPTQVAITVATPVIVTPAGVAAILLFMMLAPEFPGIELSVFKNLVTIMVLNSFVMFFNDNIIKLSGLIPLLQIVGSVLGFIQVALGMQAIVLSLKSLGIVSGKA
jgi:multiple antibiotic resistance protein